MLRVLLALLFLSASCNLYSAKDIIDELIDYGEEGYECYYGDAALPPGSHAEELVTPAGSAWQCTSGRKDLRLHADGSFDVTLMGDIYSDLLEYARECGGYPDISQTGDWVVDAAGRLCSKNDNLRPAIYGCRKYRLTGEFLSLLGHDYYENGELIASELDSDDCLLTPDDR